MLRTSSSASGLSDSCILYPLPLTTIRDAVTSFSYSLIPIRRYRNRIRHAIFFCYNSKPLISKKDELWLLTPIHFDARLIDRATPVTGPYTVGRFTFRQRCGGYFRSSAAARVWCVYINSKRSKKTAPAVPAPAHRQPPTPPAGSLTCTLIPEPFTLNRETGAKVEESRNRIRGSVSPPHQRFTPPLS